MNQEFQLYGILGYPLSHTLSPVMQEAAFTNLGLKAYYLVLELEPPLFRKAMRGLPRFILDGFNVTVPYKEKVIPYLDRLTTEAHIIGAVNTVFRKGGKWIGANTDAPGFLDTLKREAHFDPRGKRALVLGAGGSARAVVWALAAAGAREIRIANRHQNRAQRIVKGFRPYFPKIRWIVSSFQGPGWKQTPLRKKETDLVVNATPVGLARKDSPLISPLVIERAKTLRERMIFFDLVYHPIQTAFLKTAKARGHWAVGGAEMLVAQGARSFEYWTGRKAPRVVMRQTLWNALRSNQA